MLHAILVGLVVGLCRMDMFFGYSMFSRPIVAASIVGLLLGDVTTGVIIGGILEVVFIGSFPVGAAVSPDGGSAAAIGTAFAIKSGGGIAIGSSFAVPLALLGGFLFILVKMINSVSSQFMLARLEKDDDKGATAIYLLGCWGATFFLYFLFGFLAVFFGSGAVEALVATIPTTVINGLASAGNMLPAVGFALLLRMVMTKKLAPYFFIGFMLAAYLGLPTIAITLFAAAIVMLVLASQNNRPAFVRAAEGGDDNEF